MLTFPCVACLTSYLVAELMRERPIYEVLRIRMLARTEPTTPPISRLLSPVSGSPLLDPSHAVPRAAPLVSPPPPVARAARIRTGVHSRPARAQPEATPSRLRTARLGAPTALLARDARGGRRAVSCLAPSLRLPQI